MSVCILIVTAVLLLLVVKGTIELHCIIFLWHRENSVCSDFKSVVSWHLKATTFKSVFNWIGFAMFCRFAADRGELLSVRLSLRTCIRWRSKTVQDPLLHQLCFTGLQKAHHCIATRKLSYLWCFSSIMHICNTWGSCSICAVMAGCGNSQ